MIELTFETAIREMKEEFTDEKFKLVQVTAWCVNIIFKVPGMCPSTNWESQ